MNVSEKLIEKYNSLNGKTITSEELHNFYNELFDCLPEENQQLTEIWHNVGDVLQKYPDATEFKLKIQGLVTDMLNGVPFEAYNQEEEVEQLGKAVSSEDIYNMVTNRIIDYISENDTLQWYSGRDDKKGANKYVFLPLPVNYSNSKYYRGINTVVLGWYIYRNEAGKIKGEPITDDRLFWLTMKQIEDAGGKLKKGSVSNQAIFYNWIYKYNGKTITEEKHKELLKTLSKEEKAKLFKIPFLRYFNVFNERDIEKIDFDKKRKQLKDKAVVQVIENESLKIEAAEKIINNMPDKPAIIEKHIGKGESPYYQPNADKVVMPFKEQYDNVAIWYGTAFHELTHSTGHAKRLSRTGITDFQGFGSNSYAFEELVAELGAAFLNAESGIFFHTIKKNASYIKGWASKVKSILKENNKAIFIASGQAQKAADFILDKDAKGIPAYLRDKSKPVVKKVEKTKVATKKPISNEPTNEEINIIPKLFTNVTDRVLWQDFSDKERKILGIDQGYKPAPKSKLLKTDGHWIYLTAVGMSYLNSFSKASKAILNKKFSEAGEKAKKKEVKKPTPKKAVKKEPVIYEVKTKAQFESELKKLGLTVFNVSSKWNDINNFTRTYQLNYKDIAGATLVLEVSKQRSEKDLTGEYNIDVFGDLENDSYASYESLEPFYGTVLDALKLKFDISLNEALKLKEKSRTTLFTSKIKNQLALLGGKKQPTTIVEAAQSTLDHKGDSNVHAPLIVGLKPVSNRVNAKAHEYYKITGDIAKLLGKIEIKPFDSVAVTLDAPQGAGKTRAFFQFINEFAGNGYKILFVSAEEHPQSSLFQQKLDQYVTAKNQDNVYAIDSTNFDEIKKLIPQFDIVFFDSWNKIAEQNKGVDFDNDLRKSVDGKLFFAIFQRTGTGTMRGGSKAQFDGDVILKIVKETDFKDNYIIADKNRYTDADIHEIKYNIYHQKLVKQEVEEPASPDGKIYIVV